LPSGSATSRQSLAIEHAPGSGSGVHRAAPQNTHGAVSSGTLMPAPNAARPALSIVSSLFGSARYVREFCERSVAAASAVTESFEIILVNDGSADNSLELALDAHRQDPRIKIIDLSRNFGHHKALMMGLARAAGHRVFLIDSDLEEEPEWLPAFARALDDADVDVVYGVQTERKGDWFERVTGRLFFAAFNRMLTHPIPPNIVTARLMTRRYVRALVRHDEREVALAGLWQLTGFRQVPLAVTKRSRRETSYTFRRRLSVFVNAITAFSNRPLIYIFQIGIGVMLLSLVAGAVLLYHYLRGGIGVPGWASIMVSIWFLGGLMIFCTGVIGVYLAKVFTEVKRRPYAIVRDEYGFGDQGD
jgi:putative glycosyltransferase